MQKIISIIIPVYNEVKNIPLIYEKIKEVLEKLSNYDWNIVFVDDGSVDNSWQKIEQLSQTNKKVGGISFSRNFGHQSALEAGLKSAEGDVVIMMDGDLQHPPSLIPELIKKWEEGFDVVNTKRRKTEKESIFKRITSYLFYQIMNKISDVHIEQGSADFRLISKSVLTHLNKLNEKDKFYRGLINWIGFKSIYVEYDAEKRNFGKTSYTFRKMLSFARVGITSFSYLPIKIIIVIGFLLFGGGALALASMIYYRYFVNVHLFSGTAILAAFIILNNGIIIIMIGIVSIYLVTMLKGIKNRPSYIISKKINYE